MTNGFPFPDPTNGHANSQSLNGALSATVPLGVVVGGSSNQGLEVRLNPDGETLIEDVKVGAFVTIQGRRSRFFGVVTDLELSSSDQRLRHNPPDGKDPLVSQVISETVAYGTVSVLPNLTMPLDTAGGAEPVMAKTIPSHFSPVFPASAEDVELVFGKNDADHFWIGNPLDMDAPVCLNLEELVKRSIGVFGKSGTGKTFLTRLLLAGILKGDGASSLVFDMHSEYGWSGQDSDHKRQVKGLKQLFPSQVSTFTLDEESSRKRGSSPDEVARIGYQEIEPDDIELLRDTLNLSEPAASAAYTLYSHYGKSWLTSFLDCPDINELARELNINAGALAALHRRLTQLSRFDFLKKEGGNNVAKRIIEHLEQGKHVVLEFGKYGDDLTAYILVSNLLSRRIHDRYVELKEWATGGGGQEPRPLVIVIEEAHKFLDPGVAQKTIFGRIARELRKYNVTLMVIDQRPSGIDSEVMSQLGTRLTCSLDNERDIESVLSGTPGSRQLRGVLARLESKQQALIFGHAVPMPVVVHTRDYGSVESYALLGQGGRRFGTAQPDGGGSSSTAADQERLDQEIDELFG